MALFKKIEASEHNWSLTGGAFRVMMSRPGNLIVSFIFPIAAAVTLILFAGQDMFVHCEGTQSACFILVCAAIWGGLFNSIEVIVQERSSVHEDYDNRLITYRSYTVSRAIPQFVLCVVQTLLLCLGIRFCGQKLPETGAMLKSPMVEYYITLLLTMYSADMLGLLISAWVRSSESAVKIAPYVLLFEIVFSGFLFEMEGAANAISKLMISRHSMAALGITSNVNAIPLQMHVMIPQTVGVIKHAEQEMFIYTAQNLCQAWLAMACAAVVFALLAMLALNRLNRETNG